MHIKNNRQLLEMWGEISGWNDRAMDKILKDLLDANSNKDLTDLTTLERAIDLYHAKFMGQKSPRSGYRSLWRSMRQSRDDPWQMFWGSLLPMLWRSPAAGIVQEPVVVA